MTGIRWGRRKSSTRSNFHGSCKALLSTAAALCAGTGAVVGAVGVCAVDAVYIRVVFECLLETGNLFIHRM